MKQLRYNKNRKGDGSRPNPHQPPMKSASYLKTFFQEKNLIERVYQVIAPDGTEHMIPTGVVIEHILITAETEQDSIAHILRQIDFKNGDVHHFLKHLAGAIAANY